MLNIGGPEMLVIALVALLVFGPNRLPEIMRNIGKAVRVFQTETRKASEMLRAGLEDTPAKPGPGVLDTPDGVAPPEPIAAAPAPPPPPRREEPPPPEHEVRPVVREYEDT